MAFLEEARETVRGIEPILRTGRITKVVGLVTECEGLSLPVGSLCRIYAQLTGEIIEAEVVGFRDERLILMLFGNVGGISRGDKVAPVWSRQVVAVGEGLLGRVLNGRGEVIDEKGPVYRPVLQSLYAEGPDALKRERINETIQTGIRSIDGLRTCGKGQRMGIFSGSGVGKSVLMGMIARNTNAEVNIIALVGERGREVRDFLERDLGEEGLARSVVIVATSDEPALLRIRAGFVAAAISDYFRDQGMDVMFMMDSVTRLAIAQREVGLSAGEPPTTKGYPPSVFTLMTKLLERSGRGETGTVTAFYTVLVDADDMNEPISDSVRGILDGHLWLSRDLAQKGHYPAIDILASVSRLMTDIASEEQQAAAQTIVRWLAAYRDAEDLITIGAYVKGSDEDVDQAIEKMPAIKKFLQQAIIDSTSMETTFAALLELAGIDSTESPAEEEPISAEPLENREGEN